MNSCRNLLQQHYLHIAPLLFIYDSSFSSSEDKYAYEVRDLFLLDNAIIKYFAVIEGFPFHETPQAK